MPVVSVSVSDLRELVGRKLTDDEIKEILPLNKAEIDDWVGDELRLEVTPDRPDLYSVEGIARQLRAWLCIKTGLPSHIVSKPKIKIYSEAPQSRPSIVSGVVRDIRFDDNLIKSFMQLQELIDLTIGRDRKKVAIGVHNLDAIKPPLKYAEFSPEEISFIPLNFTEKMTLSEILERHPKGIQYRHIFKGKKKYPVIVDARGDVVSFPPIINAERTRVTEKTKNIFIDITGHDETPLNYSLNILMTALEERGGKLEAVKINHTPTPHLKARPVKLDIEGVKRLLGLNMKDSEIKEHLERMCYGVNLEDETVLVPPYRFDILHPDDIIEDIAIAYGYNNFIPQTPKIPTIGGQHPIDEFSHTLKSAMIGLGFHEMLNFVLTSKEKLIKKTRKKTKAIELLNPVTSEYSICRTWLLPGLLKNLASNKHRRYPQRIFEVGDAVLPDRKAETRSRNVKKLAAAISHSNANFSEISSIFHALENAFGKKFTLKHYRHPTFIHGRCAGIYKNKKRVGFFGEIHPIVLENFELKMPVCALEIDVSSLM